MHCAVIVPCPLLLIHHRYGIDIGYGAGCMVGADAAMMAMQKCALRMSRTQALVDTLPLGLGTVLSTGPHDASSGKGPRHSPYCTLAPGMSFLYVRFHIYYSSSS
jgi:hypothetical protein